MEKQENPNYYSIITADVRYDKRLTPNAKLLYAEITSLLNMNGKCFATNDYFANLYGVSKVSISKWIKNLVDCGYIKSEIIYKEGSKEIDKRYLSLIYDPIKEKLNTPIKEKFKDNNTILEYNNNLIDNNKIEKIYKKEKSDSAFEEFWACYTPIKNSQGRFIAKGNKQSCMIKFGKLLNQGVKYETIINGLKEYLTYCRANDICSCGAEVFLNQRRFENDYSGSGTVKSLSSSGSSRKGVSIIDIAREFIEDTEIQEGDDLF